MSPSDVAASLARPWSLSRSVELRPEPFGALAYDFHTRRLSFLKTRLLVRVVRGLDGADTLGEALAAAEVPAGQWPAYVEALRTLARSGIVEERTGAAA